MRPEREGSYGPRAKLPTFNAAMFSRISHRNTRNAIGKKVKSNIRYVFLYFSDQLYSQNEGAADKKDQRSGVCCDGIIPRHDGFRPVPTATGKPFAGICRIRAHPG